MDERLKKLRRDLDLTQQEFAERIGIKRNTLANYEAGRNEPIDAVISLICKEFNVSEEWLRTGVGEMFAPDASNEIENLVRKYDLSDVDQALIEKYVKLRPPIRKALLEFINEVSAALDGSDPKSEAFPSGTPDIDIDAEVEAYRRQLELQKKAMGGSSLSNGTNGTL